MSHRFCLFALAAVAAFVPRAGAQTPAAPGTRELERINWMEFRELVPAKVDTVLVPLGTLEPHGVSANGAETGEEIHDPKNQPA
jgi:creatinine amidohydrolase